MHNNEDIYLLDKLVEREEGEGLRSIGLLFPPSRMEKVGFWKKRGV